MRKIVCTLVATTSCLYLFAQNVGIGISSPTYPLTVSAPTGGKGIVQKTADVEVGFYTTSGQAFLQTWSNHPLYFTTNNGLTQMALTTQGNLGIGTTAPTSMLDVNGQVRIRGGLPGAGKVLTSDANGLATWQSTGVKATNVTLAANTALSNATFFTVPLVDDNTVGFSDLFGYNNINNSFEVVASTAGTYLITGQVTWDLINSFTGEKDFVLELRNGSTTLVVNRMISEYFSTFIGSTQRSQQISCTVKLSAGQQIRLFAMHRTGTGLTQNILSGETLTYLSFIRLY